MHISLQIIIAALSVMGVYFCLKTLASLIFTSRQIATAVIIESKAQLKGLDLLIDSALSSNSFNRRRRIAVFVPINLWNECDYDEKELAIGTVDCFGAELYIISEP